MFHGSRAWSSRVKGVLVGLLVGPQSEKDVYLTRMLRSDVFGRVSSSVSL